MAFEEIIAAIKGLIPPAAVLAATALAVAGLRRFFDWRYKDQIDKMLLRQWLGFLVAIVGSVIFVSVLPIGDSVRNQILGLVGIVLSAAIALSSTNFLGNALAGMMLRGMRGFRLGDFIEAGDSFGRVSFRGLLHVELQSEDRNFICLPNLYLIKNPFKVIRSEGTVVSAEVSLGYDADRLEVERLLVAAASKTELDSPYVFIVELGNFSITYRVNGILPESAHIVSMRSRLMGNVLDELHRAAIEIVSPTFMNTRDLSDREVFPPRRYQHCGGDSEGPDDMIFDKAGLAEETEKIKAEIAEIDAALAELDGRLKEIGKDGGDKDMETIKSRREQLLSAKASLALLLEDKEKTLREID